MAKTTRKPQLASTENYDHKEQQALIRPDVGLQAQFKKKKPAKTYQYDSSLDPELSWDISADRERAESLIAKIAEAKNLDEAKASARQLKQMSGAFLNWAGKKEHSDFTVPTLPLFIHERLSTKAILESVRKRQLQPSLFADPQLDIADRVLRAYEYKTGWVNRLILGDNLHVMNSLLEYEGLGGQVQMIYMDPPYGVKFGSNFQPFIRKRDVKPGDDADFTREPEMVQAYRDTWELGIHSYLTYLRDRFKLARELLHPSGSIFVQISDENVHHVKELLDEVFGHENFVSLIAFKKSGARSGLLIDNTVDYILWYAKNTQYLKIHRMYLPKADTSTASQYDLIELPDGSLRSLKSGEQLPDNRRLVMDDQLISPGASESGTFPFEFKGKTYKPHPGYHWKTTATGLKNLANANRLIVVGSWLKYKRYLDDFPVVPLTDIWTDTAPSTFSEVDRRIYAVQTATKVIARCILMTTDPGDLVLDPTCGSGTTAYCAEKWGRRWITTDVSRVPIALARQRLLTATYDWYELRDETAGLSGGFKYERKQNSKGEEIGGIVPHVTLESIAKEEKPKEEVLVDRPNITSGVVRVSGPFVVEATIPTPVDIDADGTEDSGVEIGDHFSRLFQALKQSPRLRLPGNQVIEFRNVREIAGSLQLQAEAVTKDNGDKPVAFAFGPPSSAISEKQVFEAAREAYAKSYTHLYILGFACQDSASRFIAESSQIVGIPTFYVNVTMDIQMGDLLKNQRSSQIFSMTGSPEIKLIRLKQKSDKGETLYRVELLGLDTFDPVKREVDHLAGNDVPCWLLDTDYNELSFHVCQAFFPRTSAWDNIRRSLKGLFDESVWEHLAGNTSEPFPAGDNEKVAVKVIDDRGNELIIVKLLSEAAAEG
jgi:adenine-specific DNA-methyltransferase